MKKSIACYLAGLITLLAACNKKDSNPDVPVVPLIPQNCAMLRMAQQNNGAGQPDFSITYTYDTSNRVIGVFAYDSAVSKLLAKQTFTYSGDTIRINAKQYFLTDLSGRIRHFHTLSDPGDNASDVYDYDYQYNDSGFLSVKNLYVNGTGKPDYITAYTYHGNVLTDCSMTVPAAGNAVLLSASLNYNYEQNAQNWLYHFPDGFESYLYQQCFNYGRKSACPLKKVVTQLFDTGQKSVADQWTTTYTDYQFSTTGNIIAATATGDEQQGFAGFYGKTVFGYGCK